MCELKAPITVCPMKHAFPWVFQVEVWATFCFLYFQLNRDLGCGWLVPYLPPQQLSSLHSAWINNWASSTFLFVIINASEWQLLLTLLDPGLLKNSKKGAGGMLRRLIQFLWLVSVVSHFGEALTCYSCGPHSDQVMPLTLSKSGLTFGGDSR